MRTQVRVIEVTMALVFAFGCGPRSEPAIETENAATASLTFTDVPIVGVQSNRCVDINAFSTTDGTQAQLWDCNGGTNQSWSYGSNKELVVYGNKCLEASGGGTSNLTPVVIAACTGQPHQQWNINSDQTITNVLSGLCLDAEGAGTVNGTKIILWSCGTGDNQKWTVSGGGGTTYTLAISTSGNGSTTPPPGAHTYEPGTVVSVTATPAAGATFTGWSGAATGTTNPVSITMDGDKSLAAIFSGGTTTRPCDIYAAAGTPCVAAHSTVRALYGSYSGSLYQVRRAADGATRDIPVLSAGGFANTSIQDEFCANTTCTISILYDQSPQKNDLRKAPPGATWLPNGGNESSATKGKATVGGHTVYGIYVTGFSDNVAYRNNNTTGVATGNQAEAMYMVVDGKRYSSACCFDYGNAETNSQDNGNGTMEAIYFGTDIAWGGQGDGDGPWIAADLENGMFKGNEGCYNCYPGPWPSAKSLDFDFVTAMLKGPAANTFTLKGGNAQSGTLTTMWDGSRPAPGYYPKSLEGAIILGTGGDGSNGGTGTFFEGAMTIGNPPDATDEAIQANIVAAGYGR
jgi:uncharacterized repeat protein (TIGR02543 family)